MGRGASIWSGGGGGGKANFYPTKKWGRQSFSNPEGVAQVFFWVVLLWHLKF